MDMRSCAMCGAKEMLAELYNIGDFLLCPKCTLEYLERVECFKQLPLTSLGRNKIIFAMQQEKGEK